MRILKRKHINQYDPNKSVYVNYKEMAQKQDCLAFRQIDEDIQMYQFPKHYAEDIGPGKILLMR
jgi:hypothetical protein